MRRNAGRRRVSLSNLSPLSRAFVTSYNSEVSACDVPSDAASRIPVSVLIFLSRLATLCAEQGGGVIGGLVSPWGVGRKEGWGGGGWNWGGGWSRGGRDEGETASGKGEAGGIHPSTSSPAATPRSVDVPCDGANAFGDWIA